MRSYTHLTLEQRNQIQAFVENGHTYREVSLVVRGYPSITSAVKCAAIRAGVIIVRNTLIASR
jgi:hypothetical protein